MDETTIVTADTTNDTTDDTNVIDESLEAEAKLAALEEQNKKLYARAKKAEGFTQNTDGTWVKKPKPLEVKKEETPQVRPSDILRSEEFALHREGYNEDEIDLIMKNGGRTILKDEKNPLVLGLRVSREQRKAEEAVARGSDSSGMSALERKYSKADLEKMSAKELEAVIGVAQ